MKLFTVEYKIKDAKITIGAGSNFRNAIADIVIIHNSNDDNTFTTEIDIVGDSIKDGLS